MLEVISIKFEGSSGLFGPLSCRMHVAPNLGESLFVSDAGGFVWLRLFSSDSEGKDQILLSRVYDALNGDNLEHAGRLVAGYLDSCGNPFFDIEVSPDGIPY